MVRFSSLHTVQYVTTKQSRLFGAETMWPQGSKGIPMDSCELARNKERPVPQFVHLKSDLIMKAKMLRGRYST